MFTEYYSENSWLSFQTHSELEVNELSGFWQDKEVFFLFGIHSIQGWTAATRHGVTRKRRKDEKHIGKLFRKKPKTEGVY